MKYSCRCERCDDSVEIEWDLADSDGMINCEYCDQAMMFEGAMTNDGTLEVLWANLNPWKIVQEETPGDTAILWHRGRNDYKWSTAGDVTRDRTKQIWVAMIDAPYDDETESDVEVVYEGESWNEAINALWTARHRAWSGRSAGRPPEWSIGAGPSARPGQRAHAAVQRRRWHAKRS